MDYSGRTRYVPYYNDKVVFALPGQAAGTPFTFNNLGKVDSGDGSSSSFYVYPFYKYLGIANAVNSSFLFYPSTSNEGVNVVEQWVKRDMVHPIIPPQTFTHLYHSTNITVEIPTFINKGDIENLCNDQPSFIIADYFKNLTNVSFFLDDVSATQVDPGSLSLGQHKITAKKQYHNGLYEEDFYINILAKPTPTIIADKPLAVCDGEKVTLSTQSPPAGENYTYLWSSGQTSASIEVSLGGTYSVSVSNGECFTVSPSVDITILPKPDATINIVGNTTLCAGEEVTFYAPNSTSYIWKQGNTIVGTNQSFATKLAGLYTCTVTGNNGCTNISQPIAIVVKDNPIPTVSTSGPITFCEGENVLLTAQSIGVPTAYEWSNGETTKTISVTQTGIYYVNVINQGGCEARSADIQVNVNPSPKPIITSNGLPDICQGETITLTATGSASYLWSNGATTQSIIVNSPGSYFVKTTNAQGCVRTSDPFAVTVKQKPVAVISTSGSPILCSGNTVTLTSNVGDSYLWSTGQNTQSIIVSQAGSYTVQVTSNGCSTVSNPINVTVNVPTLATISPSAPQTICFGETKTLTASQAVSYLWSNGETSSSIEVSTPGFYSVTTTDVNGCKSTSATVHIQVRPEFLPQISVVGTTTFCEGLSTTLIATTGSSYLWSTGQTTQSIIVTQAGTYNAVVTNASGCSVATNPVVINTLPSPKPFIASLGPTTFCQGDSVTLNISNPQPNTIYTWSNGSVGNNIIVKQNGSYTVYGTYQNGCIKISDPLAITVYNIAKPTISTSGPTTFCDGESITLTINEIGSSYRWSNGATTKSIIVKESETFTGFIINSQGCERESNPVSINVRANPKPIITASGPQTFCQGDSVLLSIPNVAGSQYVWSNGISGTNKITVKSSGNYFVNVTNANNCLNVSQTVPVNVYPIPKPTINVQGGLDICHGDSVILKINETGTAYRWSNGATTKSIIVKESETFTGYIINAQGCERESDPININVRANSKPVITASGLTTFCQGDSVILSIPNVIGSQYVWSNGISGTNKITVKTSGNYFVNVTNTNNCLNVSQTVPVNVYPIPKPTINVQGGLDICQGDSVILTIKETGTSYRWSNGAKSKSIIIKESETFTGYITNAQGCERESDPVSINVRPNPKPIITASGLTTFCDGDSIKLKSSVGDAYLWSNGQTTREIIVKTPGSYYVTTFLNNGCSKISLPIEINVLENLKPVITASGSTTLCKGDTVILKASPGSLYVWSTGENSQSIKVVNAGTYSVRVYNSDNCSKKSDNIVVTVNPRPVAIVTPSGPTTFCQKDSVTLNATAGGSKYVWSNGLETKSIVVKNSGTYWVTVYNAFDCETVSEPITVTVKDKPIASINVQGSLEFCKGNSVILAASKGKYYEWSTGSKDSTIKVVESGSYWVRVFNELGCSDISQFVNVVVRNPTTLVTIPDIEVCVNKSSITLNQEDPKGGKYNGVGIVQNKFNPAVAGIGKHTIIYTYFNEFGCQNNTSFTIEVTPLTELTPGQDTVVCLQSASMLLTNSSLPDGVVFSGNGVNGKKFNPLEAGLGKHIITYTYQNEYTCTSTAKRVITVNPNPTIPTYVGTTQGCKDDVLLLSASSSIVGGSSLIYRWYREGEEEPFSIGKDLIYTIRYTERLFVVAKSTLPGSCESERAEIKITAFNPEGNFTANTTNVLQGGPIKFSPAVVGAEKYTWDFGDGNKSNTNEPIHYYNSSGTFTVKMTAYSSQGCPVIVTKSNYIKVEKDPILLVPPKSNTEQVLDPKLSKKTSVYPNPLTGNRAKLKIFNNGKTTATSVFEVYAVSGNLIMRKEIAVQPGENVIEVSDFSLLNAQTYYLFVITVNDEKSVFKVLKL
ncbi:MAG: PKD domain-containing protein [Daejeonella sp.]